MNWRNDITHNIKLVIWDLDDTIWAGTLAENDEVKLYSHVKMIIETLNKRGIVNSICSKNDFTNAKKNLQKFDLWDQFVFPSIDFMPKGPKVRSLISDMQLRDENVLIIDDNVSELMEAKHFNKGINLLYARNTDALLENPFLYGTEDFTLTRLGQYKQLEKTVESKKKFINNDEFLKSINIKVRFIDFTSELFDRVHEMIERTNQLNFTKNRMCKAELKTLLEDKEVSAGCIQVIDDFGDKGLVGFYAITHNKLIHFLFSCRIMNMGIEQWVYTQLKYPELTTVGKVATTVSKEAQQIDYIQQLHDILEVVDSSVLMKNYIDESQVTSLYALGACDLFNMIGNLATPSIRVILETNTFKGNYRSVNVGTEYIRSCFDMNEDEKEFCQKYFYNYTADSTFKPKIFDIPYDYVLLSFLDDFVFHIWEKKHNKNLRIVRSDEPILGDAFTIMSKDEQGEWLGNNFDEPYLITEERFYDNLQWIRNRLSPDTIMILLNGPEYDFYMLSKVNSLRRNKEYRNQIISLNRVIERFAMENSKNVRLVNVNKFLANINDFTDYVFHWSTKTCYEVAKECLIQMAQEGVRRNHNFFNNLPIHDRKIILWGVNDYAILSYYSLISNGINIDKVCYHEQVDFRDFFVESSEILKDCKERYYIIIIDEVKYEDIKQFLINYGYNEYLDFIRYNPSTILKNHVTLI